MAEEDDAVRLSYCYTRGAEGGSPHGVRQMYWMFGLVASMACTMSPVSSGYEAPPQPLVCPAGMFVPKPGWDVFHSSGPGP